MHKVLRAIQAMSQNDQHMAEAYRASGHSFYFTYKEHLWVLWKDESDTRILSYLNKVSPKPIQEIMSIYDEHNWLDEETAANYKSTQFEETESRELYERLYNTVKEKASGMDKVFDDILGDIL